MHSKGKNYTIGSKIDMLKFTKGSTRTVRSVHRTTKPSERTMHQVHDCVRENPHTSMNDAFMDLVAPPTTYGPTPNLI
jgi:hypothetical protein